MDTWKEFEANELTHSGAHHLVAIEQVGAAYGGWARVSDIARHLNITRGSVSITLRALKKRGWVDTNDHHLVKLTGDGLKAVRAIGAKRRLLRTFLADVLSVPKSQAEIDSCKVEHLISHDTGRQLTLFLRFLSSGAPETKDLAERFREFRRECPKTRTCEVCHGLCLMDELKHAI